MNNLHHHSLYAKGLFCLSLLLSLCFGAEIAGGQPDGSDSAEVSASHFDLRTYAGKNLVLFIFSIDDPRIDEALEVMKELHPIRLEYNFELAGMAINPDRGEEVKRFNQIKGISFPVYLDYNKKMYQMLNMKGTIGFYIFNRQGKLMTTKLGVFTPRTANLAENWRVHASTYLKIGYIPRDEPLLGVTPPVPHFLGKTLSGRTIAIKDLYQRKPTVIVFFSPNCSHCKEELLFLNSLYTKGDLQGKFEIAAVNIDSKPLTTDFTNGQNYIFPVIADQRRKIASLFPSFTGSIPLSFVVDQTGAIVSRHLGFNEYLRDIYVMELRKLAKVSNPPLLNKNGYSGEKMCSVCHEKESIQWQLTRHADAFSSLVRKGKEYDENCVPCHVTGFGSTGGYHMNDRKQAKYLEDVQCESCHGPGYESCVAFSTVKPKKKKGADWKKLCLSCHTKEESLNFIFAKRYSRVIHKNAPDLSAMSREELLHFLRSYREKKNLFDNPARYVGKESCKECHGVEYRHWQTTLHATAHKTDKAKRATPEKLFRYHTGVDGTGGYPDSGREGVQCEACHGPAENHLVKPEAKGHDYIVGLDSDCPSCVVEQICRRCHSTRDDPGFVFEKALEQIRHKPVEP